MLEFIAAVRRTIETDSRIYVTFDAKLNSSRFDLAKYLKIRYEIHKKNIEFCSKINVVNSFLNTNMSINTENMYV